MISLEREKYTTDKTIHHQH